MTLNDFLNTLKYPDSFRKEGMAKNTIFVYQSNNFGGHIHYLPYKGILICYGDFYHRILDDNGNIVEDDVNFLKAIIKNETNVIITDIF